MKRRPTGVLLSRRAFLLTSTALSLSGCTIATKKPEEWDELNQGEFFVFELFRPQDSFSAKVEVYGFELKTFFGRTCLVSKTKTDDDSRLLVFHFPPQHNAETALDRVKVDEALGDGTIDSELAKIGYLSSKPSKLVFRVPFNKSALPIHGKAMPLVLESLLAWENFEYVLERAKDPYWGDSPFENTKFAQRRYLLGLESWKGRGMSQVSAIDLPAGFYLQPSEDENFRWRTRAGAKRVGKYFEAWSAFVVGPQAAPVRFNLVDIWGVSGGLNWSVVGQTPIYNYQNTNKDFITDGSPVPPDHGSARDYDPTPVDFYDRIELAVTLSPRFYESPVRAPLKPPLFQYYPEDPPKDNCDRPMLDPFNECYVELDHQVTAHTYGISADGGFLDLEGNWSVLPGCTIKGWVQQTTRGRDTFVRVVRKGYLYPFGFEAELVEETERTYLRDSANRLVAPLVKQVYLRTVSPTRAGQATLEECFLQMEILTERTPPLDRRRVPGEVEHKNLDAFVAHVEDKPFEWEFKGTDSSGRSIRWSIPLYFVSNRQTERLAQGRFPENPAEGLPANAFGVNELNYIRVVSDNACELPPDRSVAKMNFIKLLDKNWAQLPYRFADLGGEVVALANAAQSGDTSVEVKWVEWVRSVRPADLTPEELAVGRKAVLRPITPRIRTARIALQGLRQFSGTVPDMLGSYRDMRVQFENGVPKPVTWSLDPEEAQLLEPFEIGLLKPDASDDETGAYFCVLPAGDTSSGSVASRRDRVLLTYYPGFTPPTEKLYLFEQLGNSVEYGRAKNTEGLGGLVTPDGAIALLTRKFGPIGDNRQTIGLQQNLTALEARANPAGLHRFSPTAASAVASTGLVNIGIDALFGKEAEIIPGVKFSDVIKYVLQLGPGAQSFVSPLAVDRFSAVPPKGGDNTLRWQTRITGLDWLMPLLEAGTIGINVDDLLAALLVQTPPTEPLEDTPVGLEATLDWSTQEFEKFETSVFSFINKAPSKGRASSFKVNALARLDLLDPKPEISASCQLSDFSLEFLKALNVEFNHVRFDIEPDGRKRFDPSISVVSFKGLLEFINGLQKLLKGLEDEFGLKISISPARVSVSQVISFPPAGGGVIYLGPATISNLTFHWGVVIPILGRDRIRISTGLASREAPMTIAVGIYGGRAYVLLEADTKGPRLLEVSTDYGGIFQAEWSGIAKGSVSLTAGFTYSMRWADTGQSIEFVAFVQFTGKLSVVEIFSVCVHLMIALGFKHGNGRVIYGLARASCSFKLGFIKYKYQYEAYKEERSGDSDAAPVFAASGTKTVELGDSKCDLNDRGAACCDQLTSVNHFYPFEEAGSPKEWQEFFDASI